MKSELIICEKPQASMKVAEALADKKPTKKTVGKVSYYEIEHNGKKIYVAAAVGHLFNLVEKNKKKGWSYPVFEYEWKPAYEANKEAGYTKSYIDVLKKLAKESDDFVVACDFDNEGSVIGYNVIRFLCGQKDGKRMKFSTLTKDELIQSYENAMLHLDFPQIESGETRHSLDWLFGINLSRALTLSIKKATNTFKLLSTGRVQGPTLKILTEREKEIKKFKPVPYWEIELDGIHTKTKTPLIAQHTHGKFNEKKEAEKVIKSTRGKHGVIGEIKTKETTQKPPFPFDLTSLQLEAYSTIGITPQKTLEIAQDLYSNGYISYPRTSSQKLPESIGYKKILEKLKKHFPKEAEYVLTKTKLKPNEGKKEDAAHPAIYSTGDLPKKLDDKPAALYELITRRFFATFGDDAKRETITLVIDVNKEKFSTSGTRTKEKGWHELYDRFVKLEEQEMPKCSHGDEIKVKDIKLYDKETKPPARYNEASIVKEMEAQNIGTKATRASTVQNLFDRNYITGKPIEVTTLGMQTVETLEKHCPDILDVNLTRQFEENMEKIEEKKKKGTEIIEDAKKFLTKSLNNFKKHEKEIGKELAEAAKETRDKEAFVGKCMKCKEGDLQIRRGKYGFFVACNRYEQGCSNTFKLPGNALIKNTEKECKVCNYPTVLVIKAKRKPQEMCINPECPVKKEEEEKLNNLANSIVGTKCNKCETGKFVLKKGFYGPFVACDQYPKCKNAKPLTSKEVSPK